jgi:hypothetical protein
LYSKQVVRLEDWQENHIKGCMALAAYKQIVCYEISELIDQLTLQLRQAVLEVVEADPSSQYFYKLVKTGAQTQLFLIEQNNSEGYCVCHCFSSDIEQGYAYESMPLPSIRTFFTMANELGLH